MILECIGLVRSTLGNLFKTVRNTFGLIVTKFATVSLLDEKGLDRSVCPSACPRSQSK